MLLEKTRELPNVDIRLPDVTPITNVGRVDVNELHKKVQIY